MKLVIGWLYPLHMSTYGDRGNIICLTRRCRWRGIGVEIKNLDTGFSRNELLECDLLFMGGAQDRQQKLVSKDLKEKSEILSELIEKGLPGLYICGAYQFLGKYYKEADGTKIAGLGIFPLYTENPGENFKRLIGNIIFKPKIPNYKILFMVGFENHGGRTYLGKNIKPFGEILFGFGNNGKDKTEGAIYKNSFGSYLHGPILPKNPEFADYLIKVALERKYKTKIKLKKLDDKLENAARIDIAKRLDIGI